MRHLVLGTAGHIDHGKTALVRALSGVDTDRLPEEKARGISIDLGFASLVLPGGERVAIVDVPGHERFIKNMLAGSTGVDAVLLVVAADEGVMPQTTEHLDILSLLGLERGVVALSKCDLVDEEWLELVEEDVRAAVAGTFLAGAPVQRVSSVTGEGLPELLGAIAAVLDGLPERPRDALPRMPVDRAFTVAGFGTVVTGTLHCGELAVGDRLELVPPALPVRVRGLEVHGQAVERAGPGQRVAVNLSGLERAEVRRGYVLTSPDFLRPVRVFTASFRLLGRARPLANGTRVRLHLGTAEVIGRLILLDGDELVPGATGYIRFRAETPLVAFPGDRYIIRSYSPMQTVGGGVVLDTARRYRRLDQAGLARLQRLSNAGPETRLLLELGDSEAPLALNELVRRTGRRSEATSATLAQLVETGQVVAFDDPPVSLTRGAYDRARSQLLGFMAAYFEAHPYRRLVAREEARQKTSPRWEQRAFAALLRQLEAAGAIRVDEDGLSPVGHEPRLHGRHRAACERLLQLFQDAGFAPPPAGEALAEAGAGEAGPDLLAMLLERGDLVRAGELYFHRQAVATARQRLLEHFASQTTLSPAQFRDLLGTTRKYALPLLQYFDDTRFTRRLGDERSLYRPELARSPATSGPAS